MTTRVYINGDAYLGWETVSVERSIDDAVSTASFSSPLRWPGDPNPLRVRPGDEVEVFDDDDQLFDGWADAPQIMGGQDGDVVDVQARSKTSDLVDCAVVTEPYSWKDKTILNLANLLALPYSVTVVDRTLADEIVGQPIDFRAEMGEPVFDAIERMVQGAGVLIMDDGQGRLVFARARSVYGLLDSVIGLPVIDVGVNALNPRRVFRHDERYSEYRVYSQRPGNDADYAATVAEQVGIVVDPEVQRTRILTVLADQPMNMAQLQERARWEATTRAGRSVQVGYDLVGWRRPDGSLWEPGQLAVVRDGPASISATMIAQSVSWSLTPQDRRVSIALAPPEGYEQIPVVTDPATTKPTLNKPITPGSKYGVWLTAEDVAAIKAEVGQ